MDNPVQPLPQTEHDMLVTLVADVRNLSADFKNMNSNMVTQLNDHETRIRAAENINAELLGSRNALRWMVAIASAIGAVAGPLVAYIIGSSKH